MASHSPKRALPREDRLVFGRTTYRRSLVLLFNMIVASVFLLNTALLQMRSSDFMERCVAVSDVSAGASPSQNQIVLASDEDFRTCYQEGLENTARTALSIAALLGLAALLLYLALPWWRRLRGSLIPLDRFPGGSEVLPSLKLLVESSGLRRGPLFLVDPTALAPGAAVMGPPWRRVVRLNSGLLARRCSQVADFDAVVLHELAHLHNRDVDITYLNVALWRVLLVAALFPYIGLQLWFALDVYVLGSDRTFWPATHVSWSSLFLPLWLLLLVTLSRAQVLRHREHCADLDALANGARKTVWEWRAQDEVRARTVGRLRSLVRFVRGLWSTHPSWEKRHAVLVQTSIDNFGSLVTGVLAMAGLFTAQHLVSELRGAPWPPWFMTSLLYLMAVPALTLAVIALNSMAPQTAAGQTEVRPRRSTVPSRSLRLYWRRVRFYVAIAAVVLLFAADPLDGLRPSPQDPMSLPEAIRVVPPEHQPPTRTSDDPVDPMTAWWEDEGQEFSEKLQASMDIDVGDLAADQSDGTGTSALARHCEEMSAILDEARTVRDPPHENAAEEWSTALTYAQEGYSATCDEDADLTDAETLSWIEVKHSGARMKIIVLRLGMLNGNFLTGS